jgi:hypothetical protein
VIPI